MLSSIGAWSWAIVSAPAFILMVGAFTVGASLEFIFSDAKPEHYRLNLSYAIVNKLVVALIAPWPAIATVHILQQTGRGYINFSWLAEAGLVGAVIALIISTAALDFFYYWMHRFQHTLPVLWQEHLLHHSDEHVNITTSARTHILETVMWPFFISIPMALLLKLPPVQIVALAFLPSVWGYVVHLNVRLGWGRFWWLFSSPQHHRIHHSVEPKHFNKNYAVWFPFWDILFGTAYKPQPGEFPATGVSGVTVQSVHHAYALPFIGWWKMLSRSTGQSPADVVGKIRWNWVHRLQRK